MSLNNLHGIKFVNLITGESKNCSVDFDIFSELVVRREIELCISLNCKVLHSRHEDLQELFKTPSVYTVSTLEEDRKDRRTVICEIKIVRDLIRFDLINHLEACEMIDKL